MEMEAGWASFNLMSLWTWAHGLGLMMGMEPKHFPNLIIIIIIIIIIINSTFKIPLIYLIINILFIYFKTPF